MLCALALLLPAGGCATKSAAPPGAHPARVQHAPASGRAAAVVRTARTMIGAPYKWGGESPREGFDCSGLIWFSYRQHGITLPRVSWQQFSAGRAVSRSSLRPGDLVFTRSPRKANPACRHRHRPGHLHTRPQFRQTRHGIVTFHALLANPLHRSPPRAVTPRNSPTRKARRFHLRAFLHLYS